jgi:uracil-DNA glycosylase family 4
LSFEELYDEICRCKKCRLWRKATQAVPGEGPTDAKLMFVGQNPGAEEDKAGKPFVGRAGKYLNEVLAQNGFNRKRLYITNIVKHTSPKNRKPLSDEIEACVPYLNRQIEIIKPEIVVLMGKVAWQTPRQIDVRYFETIHPSAAMRFPKMKKRFEDDLRDLANIIKLH